MARRSSESDAVWRQLVALVMDTHDDWRAQIRAATDLPPGRVRALRRLTSGPRTLRELAEVIGSDAPATTVLINDLEQRGLVARVPHPTNRRAKLVSLTAAGREIITRTRRVIERAPDAFTTLTAAELAAFARVLDVLASARERT